jgi:Trypsin-co-occurring domain 2
MVNGQTEEILPLAEVVQTLRTEILKAAAAAGNEKIRFGVGPIDLEFQVVAKREGGPEGKIKFGIWGVGVEAGGSAKFGSERTQKVKFTLKPVRIGDNGAETEVEIFRAKRPTGS